MVRREQELRRAEVAEMRFLTVTGGYRLIDKRSKSLKRRTKNILFSQH